MGSQDTTPMPVIVNKSLSKTPIITCLAQHELKIRVSETSSESSVIFPMSSVAFYYIPVTSALKSGFESQQQRSALLQSVSKFVVVHCHCYIVMVSSDFCDETFHLLTEIQTKHLSSRLQAIPVPSATDAAAAMVDIAKQQLVQDGIGSLSKLAAASESDLMDCALDRETAQALIRFFQHAEK